MELIGVLPATRLRYASTMQSKTPGLWCLIAGACLALFAPARAEESDLAARLEREFARLASDDAAERDAAVEAIGKEGRAAEGAVRRRLEKEKDPETSARLALALDAIERTELRNIRWEPLWTAEPVTTPPDVCAVSADGRMIAAGSADGRVRLIAADGLRVLKEWDTGTVLFPGYLAFSPDGRTLLLYAAEEEREVRGWTVPEGERLPAFAQTGDLDGYLVFSGPGGRAAITEDGACHGRSGIVAVWDGPKFRATLPGAGPRFTAEGHLLARPGWIFDDPEKRTLRLVSRSPLDGKERALDLVLGSDDNNESDPVPDRALRFAAIVCDGRCDLHDLATGRRTRSFGEDVRAVVPLEDGWLTARRDGRIQWWKDGEEVRRIECGELPALTLTVFGDRFLVGRESEAGGRKWQQDFEVRSTTDGALVERAPAAALVGPFTENSFALFPEGRPARVFAAGCPAFEVPRSPYGALDWANFDVGGPRLAARSAAGLEVFDLATGRPVGRLEDFHHAVEGLRWVEAGLAARGRAWEFLFDAAGATRETRRPGAGAFDDPPVDREALKVPPNSCVAATRDGAICAWAEGALLEIRWRTPTGIEEVESDMEDDADAAMAPRDAQPCLAFSADGQRLAVRSPSQKSVDVWDLRARRRLHRLRHPLDTDRGAHLLVEFASDGRTLVLHNAPGASRPVAWNDKGEVVLESDDSKSRFEGGRFVVRRAPPGVEIIDLLATGRRATFQFSGAPDTTARILLGSADGRRVLAAASPEELWLLDLQDASQLRLSEECASPTAAVLADGLAAVLSGQGLLLFKPHTWDLCVLRPAIQGEWLAASPDGKRLAVAKGRTVTVYERR